jgi:Zn-dependent M32 family carboxypeptidase
MNDATYILRRRVIEQIYVLKKHLDLPRITVRITDDHETILGAGTMDNNVTIWITERAAKFDDKNLLHLVGHEIGHAVYKLNHKKNCPLMEQGNSLANPADLKTIVKVLKKGA